MTELTIEVKDAETKLWIKAPQVEALGMKDGQLILRATFPIGSLYGDATLLTKKVRIRRNGKKHVAYKFKPIRVNYVNTSLTLTVGYKPVGKEVSRLRDLRLPKYTGCVQEPPVVVHEGIKGIDWDEAALYR